MPNPQEQKWLDAFIDTGDANLATVTAYPNTGKKAKDKKIAISVRTSELKTKLQAEIHHKLGIKLTYGALDMLKVINDLANGKDVSDSVRLGAAKDWLDRANIKPKEEASQKVQIIINNQPVSVDNSTQTRPVIDVNLDPE